MTWSDIEDISEALIEAHPGVDPLAPLGSHDGLLLGGQPVIGLLSGKHFSHGTLGHAGRRLELAPDAGPVGDLL